MVLIKKVSTQLKLSERLISYKKKTSQDMIYCIVLVQIIVGFFFNISLTGVPKD